MCSFSLIWYLPETNNFRTNKTFFLILICLCFVLRFSIRKQCQIVFTLIVTHPCKYSFLLVVTTFERCVVVDTVSSLVAVFER